MRDLPEVSKRPSAILSAALVVGCGSLVMAACAGRGDRSASIAAEPDDRAEAPAVAQDDNATVDKAQAPAEAPPGKRLAQAGAVDTAARGALAGSVATETDPVLARGQELFTKYCTICHGDNGDGVGKFAYLMNPRPRNFLKGDFKLATTQNQIPTEDDLIRTIGRGMPGSAMPPWDHLPLSDLQALARYVRAFHAAGTRAELQAWVDDGSMNSSEVAESLAERTEPGSQLVVAPEPAFDEIRWFRGRRLYLENCASCHGADGHPVADAVKFDAEGYPVPPRSFVNGIFKGGSDGHQLYARIWKGMKGTPMPASEGVYSGDEMWDIIHYTQSLARPGAQERAQLRQGTFVAPSVRGSLPSGPADPTWEQARPLYVALTPLWWTEQRIEGLMVQALHNDEELAIRLSWLDLTPDQRAVRHDEFRDGVAIQFSLSSDPPFYMGDAGDHGGVNIWYWKADRGQDIAGGYQDVDSAFPDRAVDMYPEQEPPAEAATFMSWPRATLAKHDPQFVTAWGAGNLVANPEVKTPVECLTARGPGTLAGKPAEAQLIQGQAVYERGVWSVQLQRSMQLPHDHAHEHGNDERLFKPGDYLPVSFAIWNGSAGDRDGKKNISIWQKLVIE
ncbi:MAG: c-type cytochrome [bacterium]|nr:c-type cytochrome [bacterium]